MEARAEAKYVRCSPQKVRLVVDLIRGRQAGDAVNMLRFTKKGIAGEVQKVLESAIANAQNRFESLDPDLLFVSRAYVNEGPRMKRIRPAPMGRAYRYQRRLSHVVIHVAERRSAVRDEKPPAGQIEGGEKVKAAARDKAKAGARARAGAKAKAGAKGRRRPEPGRKEKK